MSSWKLIAAAMKAQRTWKRLPPERRRQILEQAAQQARRHGPVVAQKVKEQAPVVADKVRAQAPVVAGKVREQAPVVAGRLRRAIDSARAKPPKQE